MSLFTSLRSEALKTKRTAAFYFTLVGAAIVPVAYLIDVIADGIEDTKKDPFNAIFKLAAEMNGIVIFPWFIVLICTLLPQIEYKNNSWKQVFASPQTRTEIFLAKFLNIHLLLLVFIVAHHLFMFAAASIAHFVMPELNLLNQPLDVKRILVNIVNGYITVLAIGAIQFWLGIRFRNFIVPVAIGLALWFVGTLMVFESKSPYSQYFPYSFQIYGVNPAMKQQLNQVEWTSFGYTVLFLVLGFVDFTKRRITA